MCLISPLQCSHIQSTKNTESAAYTSSKQLSLLPHCKVHHGNSHAEKYDLFRLKDDIYLMKIIHAMCLISSSTCSHIQSIKNTESAAYRSRKTSCSCLALYCFGSWIFKFDLWLFIDQFYITGFGYLSGTFIWPWFDKQIFWVPFGYLLQLSKLSDTSAGTCFCKLS